MKQVDYAFHFSKDFRDLPTDMPWEFIRKIKALQPPSISDILHPARHTNIDAESVRRFENEGGSLGQVTHELAPPKKPLPPSRQVLPMS